MQEACCVTLESTCKNNSKVYVMLPVIMAQMLLAVVALQILLEWSLQPWNDNIICHKAWLI